MALLAKPIGMLNVKKTLGTAIVAAFVFVSGSGLAQAASLVGTWHGTIELNGSSYSSTLVLSGNGRFQVSDRSNSVSLEQTGTWSVSGSTLHIIASSQTRCAPGCAATEVPGPGEYRVDWINSNEIRLYDLKYGGPSTLYQRT